MRLKNIQVENFRNHHSLAFQPEEGITVLYGPNGSGKTSVLEAIHYCALTKSLLGAPESECLAFSEEYFIISGEFVSTRGTSLSVKVSYGKDRGKLVQLNQSEVKPFSQHVGTIPCITFSPSEIAIVNGSPGERRRFLDNALSQSDRRYLDELLDYRRVLQQRNALLLQLASSSGGSREMLDLWTENLADLAAGVTLRRISFLGELSVYFEPLQTSLAGKGSHLVTYRSSFGTIDSGLSRDELRDRYIKRFKETQRQELLRTQTMSGPHRDDLLFLSNGREIKKYGSQGQQRAFLISLKLALFRYFSHRLPESPICLFDDMFSELDAERTSEIFNILEDCGQTILTTTDGSLHPASQAVSVTALPGYRGG
ncbi:DNA replication/repair protein RecF [Pelodictyon luteolum]|uniref:DNA replication and repair protein RecF n=1 Tax=Chlorobium luteolum (strain DSM 273 / BCRC 81028 / 2530) TaxID=319225 RepID=RECF_CHLL3|nr:DNA replication and repair protein RecF [Pelodictyon luteolum]Q3B6Y7.1 RecName: Full=DNA replication and repair protein RecF [Pelodictyon luteolum DSM 273]ABB22894.1 RecF protein [Pelodictyon luteolum DSM 273]